MTFVIYDDREESRSNGRFFTVILSPSSYQRLTVSPGLWMAFKCNGKKINLILNVANMEHDPNEIDRLNLDQVDFDWESL